MLTEVFHIWVCLISSVLWEERPKRFLQSLHPLCVHEVEYVYVWKTKRECSLSNICFPIPLPLILTEACTIPLCKSIPDSLEAETPKQPRERRKPHPSSSLSHHSCHSLPRSPWLVQSHMSDIFWNQSEVSPTQPVPMTHCMGVNFNIVQNRLHWTVVVNKFMPQDSWVGRYNFKTLCQKWLALIVFSCISIKDFWKTCAIL